MSKSLRDTLLEEAHQLFLRNGIESYSPEQLIAALDVSPPTFREMFRDKADLVFQVTQYDIARQHREHEALFRGQPNAIKRLLSLLEMSIRELRQVSPEYIRDIQHYPAAWELAMQNLAEYSQPQIHNLLNDGVLQKMVRGDINIALVTKIIMEMFNLMLNEHIFPPNRYSLAEVYRSIYLYYIRGLCTEEGMQEAGEFFARM